MNDQEYEELKAKILGYCETWKERLNLSNWDTRYVWCREGLEADPERKGLLETSVGARTECDWRYLFCHIYFNMPNLLERSRGGEDDDVFGVEGVVVHELMHCWIDEIGRGASDAKVPGVDDHIEHVTTILTRLVLWSKDWWTGKEEETEYVPEPRVTVEPATQSVESNPPGDKKVVPLGSVVLGLEDAKKISNLLSTFLVYPEVQQRLRDAIDAARAETQQPAAEPAACSLCGGKGFLNVPDPLHATCSACHGSGLAQSV